MQTVVTNSKGNKESPFLSIQDRRKQILRQVTDKKKAISTSLSAGPADASPTASLPRIPKKSRDASAPKRSLSPSPVSNRRAYSKSPKRPRSSSPMEENTRKKRKKSAAKSASAKQQEVS